MDTHADKTQENKSQSVASTIAQKQKNVESTFQFVDNRPEAIVQKKLQEMANNNPQVAQLRAFGHMASNSPQAKQSAQLQAMANNHSAQQQQPIQKKENNTGLPDKLKAGIENLSGYSMDDVRVHYNSDKPTQLQAHAYAQGTDIHIGSGQEKHLPHEAWHVVQQKQGRVKPTMQMKGKVNVNDDTSLEKEADVMGAKAMMMNKPASILGINTKQLSSILQMVVDDALIGAWNALTPTQKQSVADDAMTSVGVIDKGIKNKNLNSGIERIVRESDLISSQITTPSDTHTATVSAAPQHHPDITHGPAATRIADPIPDNLIAVGNMTLVPSDITTTAAKITIKYEPHGGFLPPGTVVGFIQIVQSSKLDGDSKERSNDHDDKYSIDRQSVQRNLSPYFGFQNDRSHETTVFGTEIAPAVMVDAPSYSGKDAWNPKFETSAVIIACPAFPAFKGTILSTIGWDLTLTAKKDVNAVITHYPLPIASKNFLQAAKIWNEIIYSEQNSGEHEQQRELITLKGLSR